MPPYLEKQRKCPSLGENKSQLEALSELPRTEYCREA
jgi:hypothetical protein